MNVTLIDWSSTRHQTSGPGELDRYASHGVCREVAQVVTCESYQALSCETSVGVQLVSCYKSLRTSGVSSSVSILDLQLTRRRWETQT